MRPGCARTGGRQTGISWICRREGLERAGRVGNDPGVRESPEVPPARLALESPRPAKWSPSMKLFVCALLLGTALLVAGSASARPFFRPPNVPAGEIVVPPEWAGIRQSVDSTYDCNGDLTGT